MARAAVGSSGFALSNISWTAAYWVLWVVPFALLGIVKANVPAALKSAVGLYLRTLALLLAFVIGETMAKAATPYSHTLVLLSQYAVVQGAVRILDLVAAAGSIALASPVVAIIESAKEDAVYPLAIIGLLALVTMATARASSHVRTRALQLEQGAIPTRRDPLGRATRRPPSA